MIEVFRQETKAVVRIDVGLGIQVRLYQFIHDVENPVFAELLTRHLRQRIAQAIETMCASAYRDGYADGRSHRAKAPPIERRLPV